MAANTDRQPGNASYFTFNGVNIPITKVTPKVTRKLGDSTDSGDYSNAQDMIGTTQIPCSYTVEAAVEGRFRLSVTPSSFLSIMLTNATQIPVVIGVNASPTIWGHGNCDISDFTTEMPVDDVINFSCNIKSWGIWTLNA